MRVSAEWRQSSVWDGCTTRGHMMPLNCACRGDATVSCTRTHHGSEQVTQWNKTKKRWQATHDHQMDGPRNHVRSTRHQQVCPGRAPKKAERRAVLKDASTPRQADRRADSRSICKGERAEQRCSHGTPRSAADRAHLNTQPTGRSVGSGLASHLVLWIPWLGSFLS